MRVARAPAGDYQALGIGFDERWARFEESVAMVKALLAGDPPLTVATTQYLNKHCDHCPCNAPCRSGWAAGDHQRV